MQISDSTKEIHKLNQQLAVFEEKLKSQEQQILDFQHEKDELKKTEYSKQLQIELKYQRLLKDEKEKISILEKKLKEEEQKLANKEQEVILSTEAKKRAETQKQLLENQLKSEKTEKEAMEKKISSKDAEIVELEKSLANQIKAKNQQIVNLEKDVVQHKKKVERIMAALSHWETENSQKFAF